MGKLVIDIGTANLVVEKYAGEFNEFVVYLADKADNCITQDIALVRRAKNTDDSALAAIECLVWSDHNNEDYTHKFLIKQYLENDCSSSEGWQGGWT